MNKVDPARTYLIKGTTLNELIERKLVVAGRGLVAQDVGDTRVISLAPQALPCTLGVAWRTVNGSTGWWLSSGHVTTGYNTIVVPYIFIGTQDPSARAGKTIWIKAEVTGELQNTVLQTKLTLDAATTGIGTTVPTNVIPKWDSLAGVAYIPVGMFEDSAEAAWVQAGCGNISLGFCPGGFTYRRI